MDDKIWARRCYILDLAVKDPRFLEAREHFNKIDAQFYDYLKNLPLEDQCLLGNHMRSLQALYHQLFSLACTHLQIPEES